MKRCKGRKTGAKDEKEKSVKRVAKGVKAV